ncbi:hypothetical protein CRE_21673 [Caenorhabditis remanei]|uniref:DNA methylase N-4/N-6 domain-containing protein n=1 Tax=Caenorhabditis remanei TaxID=31234 RepID=E3NSF4_CAERE|nr:hypothetical protein CRE_21673 [Caenorhabditis remanei]
MLKPSGVLAICIDSRELFHLGQMLDELFGEENRLAIINWQKSYSPRSDNRHVSTATEYVLVYAKDERTARTGLQPRTASMDARYRNPDSDLRVWKGENFAGPKALTHQGMVYGIQSPFTGEVHYPPVGKCWRSPQNDVLRWLADWDVEYELRTVDDAATRAEIIGVQPKDVRPVKAVMLQTPLPAASEAAKKRLELGNWSRIIFGLNGEGRPQQKKYLDEVKKGRVPMTYWADDDMGEDPDVLGDVSWEHQESGHSQAGVNELTAIVGAGHGFETVKPMKLITKLIQIWCPPNGIVLDPFAGSGTTGHAVLHLNHEQGSERRFILIEQGRPENGDSYAKTLTVDRLRRVISGAWEGKRKHVGLGGGFTFKVLEKKVDAKTLLLMERDEMVDTVIASHSSTADRYIDYVGEPIVRGRRGNTHDVPFYQSLSSITGSGKTAILAQAVSEIVAMSEIPPVILWLSKGKVVVQQSYANLEDGGKYSHLLPDITVRLLSQYDPEDVANEKEALLYFATVGTFNQRDRENSNLRIFALDTDNIESTRWEALKTRETSDGRRRPLVIVYDESQNLSDQQTTLLLEQQPTAFLLASATLRFPAQFDAEVIQPLKTEGEYTNDDLITSIRSATVVSSGLVKGLISLDGLNTPMEEAVSEMLTAFHEAEEAARAERLSFLPKAIYVCNTNVLADDASQTDDPKQPFDQRQAPPILIWRYLTEQCGIPAGEVAVYADLKTHKDSPLPADFSLFSGGDKDYENFIDGDFRHIIFNQTLQEGWDDPSVYFAYVDKTMESSVQITQIVGRVLRQPGATHYEADRLNTAHFFVRVDKNDAFTKVVDDVRKGLGGDAPEVRVLTSPPGIEAPVSLFPKESRTVPRTAIDNLLTIGPVEKVLDKVNDYTRDTANTRGAGRRRTVTQTIGAKDTVDSEWIEFEQSNRVNARWAFRREVARRYRPALFVMHTDDQKFDAKVGVGSRAYSSLADNAAEAVEEYLRNAVVKQLKPKPYEVGGTLVRRGAMDTFQNALHEGYDGLNEFERRFARALDDTGLTWARNRPQTGYKIPLVTLGQTVWFFPDFLVWSGDEVLCVDTKGDHIVEADARRKLLSIQPHKDVPTTVKVKFVTEGTWKADGTRDSKDGFSVWELGSGQALRTLPHEDLEALVKSLR